MPNNHLCFAFILVSLVAAVNCFSSRITPNSVRSTIARQCCENVMNPEFELSDKEMLQFMRDGHLLKRGLINPGLITDTVAPSLYKLYDQNVLTAWKHKLKINLGLDSDTTKDYTVPQCEKLLEEVDKEDIPFMQLFNMWYQSDDVRSLALSTELGRVAAQLLGMIVYSSLFNDSTYKGLLTPIYYCFFIVKIY